ncbi:UNVERIFIED_CONTAM: hypothetical protein RMT77_004087 [Armadillidium vulgare]
MGLKESIFQLNSFLSSLKPPEEYPYSNDHNETTQIGNGQIPRESDESRRGSIKITIPRELPQRYVLVLMGFFALVNIYMMHLNLFVALPAMIDHNATESLRALTQGNKSTLQDLENQNEKILTDLDEGNETFNKIFKHKDKRKEVDNGSSSENAQILKHDVEFPEDVITIPKVTASSQVAENLTPSLSRISTLSVEEKTHITFSTSDSAVNANKEKSEALVTSSKYSGENYDISSTRITLKTGKNGDSGSTTENTPLTEGGSRRKREVVDKSTNQTLTTEVTQEFTHSSSFENAIIDSTTPNPEIIEIETRNTKANKEIIDFSSIVVTTPMSLNSELTSNKVSPESAPTDDPSEVTLSPILNSSSQVSDNIDITNETLELNSTSRSFDLIENQKEKILLLNESESSKENIDSELNFTTPSASLSNTTESALETSISNEKVKILITSEGSFTETNDKEETTLTSSFHDPTTPVLEATTLVTNNFDNDRTMNPENFLTESPLNVNQETSSVPSMTTPSPNISNDETVLPPTDITTGEPKITGLPLFTIPPIKSTNNTIIPEIINITTETTFHNSSFDSEYSLSSEPTNVGVPLPIFNDSNAYSGNDSLSFPIPLSTPCKMFPSTNCTFKSTYDVLDKVGLENSNKSRSQWVTLRPLPKNDPRNKFRSGLFSHLFGIDEEDHKKRVSRKYNFTDHFKLVNCSRVKALENDESDNEIKCYSSLGEIRLNIIDENGQSSSSSSSSSSEEGGESNEEGISAEVGEHGEEDKDKEKKGKDKKHEEDDEKEEDKKEKRKTNQTVDGKNEAKGKILKNKTSSNQKRNERKKDDKNEDENEENDEEYDYTERKISTRFPPTYLHKYFNKDDSSEEEDEDEDEDEEEEEGEEGEDGEEGEEDEEKNGDKYGNSPIKLDEKIPSSVCFVKKIVAKITFEGYEEGEFVWLPSVQSEVLGAYYWGFVLTQIPSGKLSTIIGGKVLVLIGIVSAGLITLLSPVLASSGAYWLLTGRIFLGMAQGLCMPALQGLLAQWAPPLERTRMVAFTYSGIAIGAALGGPFSEYILQFIGWRTLFYTQGILALLWGMFWFFLVSDSPSNHPKITNKERQKILTSIGQQHAGKGVSVPWCSIIRSQHVLALMLAQGSFKWAWHNLIHYAPRYSLTVLHRSRPEVEFVWGAALTSMFVVTCAYGAIADWLRKSRKTSTEFVRRAANSICSLLTAAFLVGVAQSYCHISAVKVCFAFAIAVGIPGAFSGIYVNSIDLAPNHAAVITGICGTFATTANILAPFYWGLIVYERPTLERWRTIWYTSAIFLLLANCLYFLLVGTKEQRWNRPVTLTKGNKRREEDQGAISKRRMNYTHGFKNQAYVSTEHL